MLSECYLLTRFWENHTTMSMHFFAKIVGPFAGIERMTNFKPKHCCPVKTMAPKH